jgi:hypothetical protein
VVDLSLQLLDSLELESQIPTIRGNRLLHLIDEETQTMTVAPRARRPKLNRGPGCQDRRVTLALYDDSRKLGKRIQGLPGSGHS